MPLRRPRRRALSLALAVAAFAVAASVAAKPPRQHYANSSVQLDLAIPGATVCMIRPASQRVVANCQGFAPDAIAAQLPALTDMAALVQEGSPSDRRVWLLAAMIEPRGGGVQMSIEGAEEHVKGSVVGASKAMGRPVVSFGLAPRETHTRLVAGGGLVLRQRFEAPASDSGLPAVRFASAALIGHDNITALAVSPVAPSDVDVDDALTRVLARVTIKPPLGPVEWRTQNFWRGYYLAVFAGPTIIKVVPPVVGLIADVVF